MRTAPLTAARLRKAGIGIFFRPKELGPLGISFPDLQRFVATGTVEKIGAGLYRLAAPDPDEMETIAMVAAATSGGIVCLLSALRIHGIGTQSPHEVWLALNRKARKPLNFPAKVRIVRFSGPMLTYGVKAWSILGVSAKVTTPARTVVDCFRYRHKIGSDMAIEALREALRARATTVDAIMRAAEVCRAKTILRTYLEALT